MELTDTNAVATYLHETCFATRNIQRINRGINNFVYRLYFDRALNDTSARTAILKYAAPYLAFDPNVSLPSERQLYEVKALECIPWQEFELLTKAGDRYSAQPTLKLPKVYYHDPQNHVVVMEDCAHHDTSSNEEESNIDFIAQAVLDEHSAPPCLEQLTAESVGSMLGSFLARMHAWGRTNSDTETVKFFDGNISAKGLIAQETFDEVFYHTETNGGYIFDSDQKSELSRYVVDLKRAYERELETVLVGDFHLGNVLFDLETNDHSARTVTIIDWEFAMRGPAFVDLGWFLGDATIDLFESKDKTYLVIVESFVESYRASSEREIDCERSLQFCVLHILANWPQRIKHQNGRITLDEARPFLDAVVHLVTSTSLSSERKSTGDHLDHLMNGLKDIIAAF